MRSKHNPARNLTMSKGRSSKSGDLNTPNRSKRKSHPSPTGLANVKAPIG